MVNGYSGGYLTLITDEVSRPQDLILVPVTDTVVDIRSSSWVQRWIFDTSGRNSSEYWALIMCKESGYLGQITWVH
jgi:hypothetical protein